MSLDYNLTKIKDRSVHFPPVSDPEIVRIYGTMNLKVFEAIWSCIPVGIGEITEENADEWYDRYRFYTKMSGSEATLTREDVHHLVGLSTNVFPNQPLDEWFHRLWKRVQEGSL